MGDGFQLSVVGAQVAVFGVGVVLVVVKVEVVVYLLEGAVGGDFGGGGVGLQSWKKV